MAIAGIRNGITDSSDTSNICSHMGMVDPSQDLSKDQIHQSALEGVSESRMVTLAMQHGVDHMDMGCRTPLMNAILGNHPIMCETLINLNADVNILDQEGYTPLLWATYQAQADIMRILLT